MIKIYRRNEIKQDYISRIINDEDIWDFSITELSYLLKEHNGESFVLINDRLYEYVESEEI